MKILPKSHREYGLGEEFKMGTALGSLGSVGTLQRTDDKTDPQLSITWTPKMCVKLPHLQHNGSSLMCNSWKNKSTFQPFLKGEIIPAGYFKVSKYISLIYLHKILICHNFNVLQMTEEI